MFSNRKMWFDRAVIAGLPEKPQAQRLQSPVIIAFAIGVFIEFAFYPAIQIGEKPGFFVIVDAKIPGCVAAIFLPDDVVHIAVQPDLIFEHQPEKIVRCDVGVFGDFQQHQFVIGNAAFDFLFDFFADVMLLQFKKRHISRWLKQQEQQQ